MFAKVQNLSLQECKFFKMLTAMSNKYEMEWPFWATVTNLAMCWPGHRVCKVAVQAMEQVKKKNY